MDGIEEKTAYLLKKMPVVSVVMHVYNKEQSVKKAIDNILNQTFINFEFIIIDDGSNDNTWNIISSYQDKRIMAFQNKTHFGNYPSRNKALQISKGNYIAVMDANTIALPDRLKIQYEYLEKYRDVVAVGSQYVDTSLENDSKSNLLYNDICIALLDDVCILHSSLMIRTELFRKLGGYDSDFPYASDYDLQCRLILEGEIRSLPVKVVDFNREKETSFRKREKQIICSNYQASLINKYKNGGLNVATRMETGYPYMGKAICLYILAEQYPDNAYENQADELLNSILENIKTSTAAVSEGYLWSVGCGMIYLLRNGIVEGDEDEILEEMDAMISATMLNSHEYTQIDWASLLYYLRKRITREFTDQLDNFALLKNKETLLILLDLLERSIPVPIEHLQIKSELEVFSRIGLYKPQVHYLLTGNRYQADM